MNYYNRLYKKLYLLVIVIGTMLNGQHGTAQFKARDANNNIVSSRELQKRVVEHLLGIKDHSLGKNGTTFFGLSKIDATVLSKSECIGPVCGSLNEIRGTFETAGVKYPIKLETVEVAGNGAAVSGGVSMNRATVVNIFRNQEIDFVTLRVSGSTDIRTVLKSLSNKVPVLGKLAKKSGAIDKVADVVEPILGKIRAGATVRFDILPKTSKNPYLSFRLATQFDVVAADGVKFESRKFKGGSNGAGVKTFGGQFQFYWPHIEALTEFRFSGEVRGIFDDTYSPLHPDFFEPNGSILYDYDPEAESLANYALLGTGFANTAIAASTSHFGGSSGYQVQENQGGSTRKLVLAPTAYTVDDLFGDKRTPIKSAIGVAPFNAIGGTFIEGNNKIVNTAILNSDAVVTYSNSKPQVAVPLLDNYQGVDFTNLKVVGLDVNQTTKAVNFILKGERKNASVPSNLNTESTLLKTVFIEALSIPNDAQFVSLETNPPEAVAYEPFKHTRMGQAFFVADEKMKKDFAKKVYVNAGGTNMVQQWYNRLENAGTSGNFLRNLFDRGVIPEIGFHIRANIIPIIPNGNKDGSKVFIQDAKYDIKVLDAYANLVLRNINGGNVTISNNLPPGTVGINNQEFNLLVNQLNQFNGTFVQKTLQKKAEIVKDINDGVGQYKTLQRILPAIVAAHWYKQSDLADGSLKDIIDTGNLSNKHTGYNLSRPFNQALWDSKASQLLATLNSNAAGYQIVSDITGGVTINENVGPAKLKTNLSNVQKVIFDQSLVEGYTNQDFVSAGGIRYSIAELVPAGLVALSNTENLTAFNLNYIENRPIQITLGVANNGNRTATNVLLRWYAQKGTGTKRLLGSKRISSITPYSTATHSFSYNPGKLPGNLLTQAITISYTVNEDKRISELSYTNNKMERKLRYGYIINEANVIEKTYNWELESSSNHLFSANEYARIGERSVIHPNAKLSMHATSRVVLEPGFKAKNGSTFRAWIGTDLEAINEYNRLNPVSRTTGKNTGEGNDQKNALPLVVRKIPVMARDARVDALRSKNLEEKGFSKPEISNYEILELETPTLPETNTFFKALYPNPVNGQTKAKLFLTSGSRVTFDLFSSNGVKIKTLQTTPQLHEGLSTITLDLSDIAGGVYIITATSNEAKQSKIILKK